jgi:hypothetical protein
MTTLHIRDSGELKVLDTLRMTISAGIHEEDGSATHDQGPLSLIEVAAVNEFGGGRIPARMWLRGWTDGTPNVKAVVDQIKGALYNMARTQQFSEAPFREITRGVARGIRDRVLSGAIRPLNAPSTLARKAPETRPLVEHGQMADAIQGKLTATGPRGIAWNAKVR